MEYFKLILFGGFFLIVISCLADSQDQKKDRANVEKKIQKTEINWKYQIHSKDTVERIEKIHSYEIGLDTVKKECNVWDLSSVVSSWNEGMADLTVTTSEQRIINLEIPQDFRFLDSLDLERVGVFPLNSYKITNTILLQGDSFSLKKKYNWEENSYSSEIRVNRVRKSRYKLRDTATIRKGIEKELPFDYKRLADSLKKSIIYICYLDENFQPIFDNLFYDCDSQEITGHKKASFQKDAWFRYGDKNGNLNRLEDASQEDIERVDEARHYYEFEYIYSHSNGEIGEFEFDSQNKK